MPVERTIGGPALSPPEQIPGDRRRRTEPRRRLPSIRGRLRRLVILSVGIALACSALLSVWQATRTYLVDKRETLLATANVIAGSSSRAVAAGYAVLLRDSLRPVARLPGVSYARIEGADGRVLGETGGTVRLSSEMALDQTESDSVYAFLRTRTVQVSVPIIYAGAPVGRVILVSKTGDLAARFLGVFVIASLGAVDRHRHRSVDRLPAAALHNLASRHSRRQRWPGSRGRRITTRPFRQPPISRPSSWPAASSR